MTIIVFKPMLSLVYMYFLQLRSKSGLKVWKQVRLWALALGSKLFLVSKVDVLPLQSGWLCSFFAKSCINVTMKSLHLRMSCREDAME